MRDAIARDSSATCVLRSALILPANQKSVQRGDESKFLVHSTV